MLPIYDVNFWDTNYVNNMVISDALQKYGVCVGKQNYVSIIDIWDELKTQMNVLAIRIMPPLHENLLW